MRHVTVRRRAEIAAILESMPPPERRGQVRALAAFTAAGGEPVAELEKVDA